MGRWINRGRHDSWGMHRAAEKTEPLSISWRAVMAGAILVLLALEVVWYFVLPKKSEYESTQNKLAVGQEAKAVSLNIPIYRAAGPVTASVRELQRIRRDVAKKHDALLSKPYRNFDLLFISAVSGKPWWSVEGYYFTGKSQTVTPGTPAELLGIANPFLLVVPDFTGLSIRGRLVWDAAKINPDVLASPEFPFRPEPHALEWFPGHARAEVKYSVSHYIDMVNRWAKAPLTEADIRFDAVTYNAMEFGYRYAGVLLNESSNIQLETAPSPPAPVLMTYINSRDACGNPEGCNVRAALPRGLVNIRAAYLPALAVFGLWKEKPESSEVKPDLRFAIIIK